MAISKQIEDVENEHPGLRDMQTMSELTRISKWEPKIKQTIQFKQPINQTRIIEENITETQYSRPNPAPNNIYSNPASPRYVE